jgi:hypothetical protein
MNFFQEHCEIINQTQTDSIYQFSCVLEREINRNSQDVNTFSLMNLVPLKRSPALNLVGSAESIVTSASESGALVSGILSKKFSDSKSTKSSNSTSTVISMDEAKKDHTFKNDSNLKNSNHLHCQDDFSEKSDQQLIGQVLKTQNNIKIQNSTGTRELITNESRNESLLSNSSNVQSSFSSSKLQPSLADKINCDLSNQPEKEVLYSSANHLDNGKLKRKPSAILQSLAEIRKGLAMKKKRELERPNLSFPESVKSDEENKDDTIKSKESFDISDSVKNQSCADSLVIKDCDNRKEVTLLEPKDCTIGSTSELIKTSQSIEKSDIEDGEMIELENISEPREFEDSLILDESIPVEPIYTNAENNENHTIEAQCEIQKESKTVVDVTLVESKGNKVPDQSINVEITTVSEKLPAANKVLECKRSKEPKMGVESSSKPVVTSFLPLLQVEKPKPKPKPEIKALQQAALAAKKV